MDLIDRQALLKQIDIDSDGEPGYYGDTWKFIDTIKKMPSAVDVPDTNIGKMELINKQTAIDTILGQPPELHYPSWYAEQIRELPPVQLGKNLAEVGAELNKKQAVKHLDLFTKEYCVDRTVRDDLMFRCNDCDFGTQSGLCMVKVMAHKLCPDYKDFGAMGDL